MEVKIQSHFWCLIENTLLRKPLSKCFLSLISGLKTICDPLAGMKLHIVMDSYVILIKVSLRTKPVEVMAFQLSYFKSWIWCCKCATLNMPANLEIWKFHSSHRTGKGQFSFQSQRKVIPKNAKTTAQLSSSHTLVKWCLKFSKSGISNMWTMNFQMFKLIFEKAEEPEIKLPKSTGSSKKEESSRKSSISALLTMPKPLTVWITIKCGKFWKRWEYQMTWPVCRSGSNS